MSPIAIVGLTVLCLGLYFVVFNALAKLFFVLFEKYEETKGIGALPWWILSLIVGIPVFILDAIHMISCIFLGIQVAGVIRDFMHKVSK